MSVSYFRCPKCGLNYITGEQRMCTVCESESKPYRGRYCRECGGKSGIFGLCRGCHKLAALSVNERRVAEGRNRPGGYRTDTGMLGVRSNKVCGICGAASKSGRLCGRCYNSIVYSDKDKDDTDN